MLISFVLWLGHPKASIQTYFDAPSQSRVQPSNRNFVNIWKTYGPIWKFSTPLHSGERYLLRSTQQHNFQSRLFSCKIIVLKAQRCKAKHTISIKGPHELNYYSYSAHRVCVGKLRFSAFQRTPYILCSVNSSHFIVKKAYFAFYSISQFL